MKFKLPTSFSPSVSQNSSAAVSKLSGGLVITDEPYNVSYGSALEVKNLWFDNDTLCKRFGQRTLGLDTEGILAMSHIPYMGKLIYHAGTSIRAYDIENGNETIVYPTESQAALTMQGGSFIEFGDYLYYKNGHEFIKINAQLEASPVTGSAPVIYIKQNLTDNVTTASLYIRKTSGITAAPSIAMYSSGDTPVFAEMTKDDSHVSFNFPNGETEEKWDYTSSASANLAKVKIVFSNDGTENQYIKSYGVIFK